MKKITFLILFLNLGLNLHAQKVEKTIEFSLSSPFTEPDGRSDYTKLPSGEFAVLSKTKGNQTGSSEFVLGKYNSNLDRAWQTVLTVESSEDFKDIFYNGQHIVLLSVVHLENEKKTKLEAYAYNPATGTKEWTKELESYSVEDWELHPHKGRVKESFIDVVCEHVNPNFVTPFEYKHNIHFSPDQNMFVSYVYNYGEQDLTATVSVYDKECVLKKRGVISIDNDFINYGFYVNNTGEIFIVNANKFGKVNLIRYNLESKAFTILEMPPGSLMKDDFYLQFKSDEVVYLANSEIADNKILGVLLAKFDFKEKKVSEFLNLFPGEFKAEVIKARKEDKTMRGDEDWKEYDIASFLLNEDTSAYIILEKRNLYATGYPHIGRDVFDKSHKKEIEGHVHTEGLIAVRFNPDGSVVWQKYIPKSQVYPVSDGLNTVSFSLDETGKELRILYAYSASMDGLNRDIKYVSIDKNTGKILANTDVENGNKLTLVKDFTIWHKDSFLIVGKKGLMGKKSMLVKYKL